MRWDWEEEYQSLDRTHRELKQERDNLRAALEKAKEAMAGVEDELHSIRISDSFAPDIETHERYSFKNTADSVAVEDALRITSAALAEIEETEE